jgi:hypothetical protein
MGVVLDVRLPAGLASAELAHACAFLAARLRTAPVTAVVCDAESLPGELAAVEALARLALVARRGGARFAVRGMRPELTSLVCLLGLEEPLPAYEEGVPQ